MARSTSSKFYRSKAWRDCRLHYLSGHPLCERCLKRGEVRAAAIVHHKIYLDNNKVQNPELALCDDNLEALCLDCHNKEHFGDRIEHRWEFDSEGQLVIKE